MKAGQLFVCKARFNIWSSFALWETDLLGELNKKEFLMVFDSDGCWAKVLCKFGIGFMFFSTTPKSSINSFEYYLSPVK